MIYILFYSQLDKANQVSYKTTSLYIFQHTCCMTHCQEIKKQDK